jgi:hypothetical protein
VTDDEVIGDALAGRQRGYSALLRILAFDKESLR